MAKYKKSMDGEEFVPTSDDDDRSDDEMRGAGEGEQVAHGHITKIEKSEQMGRPIAGHHKITIEHKHLKPGKAAEDHPGHTRDVGFQLDNQAPESTIHVPEDHGFTVGDHVSMHLKHYDGADNDSEHAD